MSGPLRPTNAAAHDPTMSLPSPDRARAAPLLADEAIVESGVLVLVADQRPDADADAEGHATSGDTLVQDEDSKAEVDDKDLEAQSPVKRSNAHDLTDQTNLLPRRQLITVGRLPGLCLSSRLI